jgi:hypothetical protein
MVTVLGKPSGKRYSLSPPAGSWLNAGAVCTLFLCREDINHDSVEEAYFSVPSVVLQNSIIGWNKKVFYATCI